MSAGQHLNLVFATEAAVDALQCNFDYDVMDWFALNAPKNKDISTKVDGKTSAYADELVRTFITGYTRGLFSYLFVKTATGSTFGHCSSSKVIISVTVNNKQLRCRRDYDEAILRIIGEVA